MYGCALIGWEKSREANMRKFWSFSENQIPIARLFNHARQVWIQFLLKGIKESAGSLSFCERDFYTDISIHTFCNFPLSPPPPSFNLNMCDSERKERVSKSWETQAWPLQPKTDGAPSTQRQLLPWEYYLLGNNIIIIKHVKTNTNAMKLCKEPLKWSSTIVLLL